MEMIVKLLPINMLGGVDCASAGEPACWQARRLSGRVNS